MSHRVETDTMGPVQVPESAYWGAQTQRAIENFPISFMPLPRVLIWALGLVKRACAQVNFEDGALDEDQHRAITAAAKLVMDGTLDAHFPVDVFQTGSGTSSNMNANEVITNLAVELLGGSRGDRGLIHPNDHVNRGQSSNDVFPTAIHVAAAEAIQAELLPALERLHDALSAKAVAFDPIIKSGRTHLMDATPVRLGQEFAGYAAQVRHGLRRAAQARDALLELALGGTAVGTGINRGPDFPRRVIALIVAETSLPFVEATDHFEAQGAQDGVVEASGQLKTIAVSLMKIANDIRWLASGPRSGLAEITLPALAPGSSIMPGKVNPVLCEMLAMVSCQVVGNDAAISLGGAGGSFELNTYLPMMAHNLLSSIQLLSNASRVFADRCVDGIQADEEQCRRSAERNLAVCTALVPAIGYERAAEISKRASETGSSVRDVALEDPRLRPEDLEKLLDLRAMTEPG